MTTILRREWLIFIAFALLQAAAMVWLSSRFSAVSAAVIVVATTAAGIVLPGAVLGSVARIRVLFASLRWWHALWAMLLCSDFVFRIRDAQTIKDNPLDLWALYRVALVSAVGLVLLWRVALRRGEWVNSLLSGLILVMALFPLAGLISTAWSVFPAWTLYKSVELLIDIAVIAAVVSEASGPEDLRSLFDWTWLLFALLQCSVWVGALVAPQVALEPAPGMLSFQLAGVLPSMASNGVGHIAAVLSVVALSRLLDRARGGRPVLLYWLVFVSSMVTLVLSQTRSALTAFMVGAALVVLLSRRAVVLFTGLIAAAILLIATSAQSTFLEYFRRGQDAQMFDSLSGRTDWWGFAWQRLMERPLSGYGAFAGGRFAALEQMGDQSTSSLHNTYLEAMLGMGIFAVVPLLICLAGTWLRLLRAFLSRAMSAVESGLALEAVGVLAVLTIRSMFTTDIIWHPALPWLLILGFGELLRREWRRADV